ncbi:MAG: pyruvate ferredoxin oxidoreductase [Armatimonadota bacterium]|nr:pyruvate ferredoxin oxidoreductase [Armatimonadota bacterium]MCX7776971.1 pyruvate ferredoxin oxidoreductase [Armatimonadota bacterium]MDW8024805.1 pyruvate ferredoxin oxidoreductase [Armatimonadota bacterium]
MRQINPDVVAAYPITPQTLIVEKFAEFVSDGLVDTEMIHVESEHSAMSACIGAAAAGARAMTSTASQGLALMWEMLYIASSLRLPIVMAVTNRALNSNLNIHCDHADTMGARDSGWIQLYSENAQEVYDNTIQAVRIAETIYLPVMVCFDGFVVSHSLEPVEVLPDEAVREFIGEFKPLYSLLDVDNPITVGPVDLPPFYMEHKRSQWEAVNRAPAVVIDVGMEFYRRFGRAYGLVESYELKDAELALVAIGSAAGTVKAAIDVARSKGIKAGLLKIRMYRPFPWATIRKLLEGMKAIGVMDRALSSNGEGGPLFTDIKAALYESEKRPKVINYIYGLGGRDITITQILNILKQLEAVASGEAVEPVQWVGLRTKAGVTFS